MKERAQQLQTTLDTITKDKQQQEKRSSTKVNKLQHDFDEERLMNEQLRQNQNYFQVEMQKLKEEFDTAMKTKNQVIKSSIELSHFLSFSLYRKSMNLKINYVISCSILTVNKNSKK